MRAQVPVISQQETVNAVIANLSIDNLQSYLATLTAFNNRHYRSTTGAQASNSIASTVQEVRTLPARLCRLTKMHTVGW